MAELLDLLVEKHVSFMVSRNFRNFVVVFEVMYSVSWHAWSLKIA